MIKSFQTPRVLLALAAVVSTVSLLAPLSVQAREGAGSVGGGLKCYNIATTDPATGKVTVTRVCYKGV